MGDSRSTGTAGTALIEATIGVRRTAGFAARVWVASVVLATAALGSPEPVAERASDAAGLRFEFEFGAVEWISGRMVASPTAGGAAVEVSLVGAGLLHVVPPDAIEEEQLLRFAGRERLAEPISSAVLAYCGVPPSAEAVERDREATADDDAASAKLRVWRSGSERRFLRVEDGFAQCAAGDAIYARFAAARFEGERLGTWLAGVDPIADEQITVGQFVSREAPVVRDFIGNRAEAGGDRSSDRGRVEVDGLGRWETWISASVRDDDGRPVPGHVGFEPLHYGLDITVREDGRIVDGVARVRLRAWGGGRRSVPLTLHEAFAVREVRWNGRPTTFRQHPGVGTPIARVDVVLPSPSEDGVVSELVVEYGGVALERFPERKARIWSLAAPRRWYPRIGEFGFATYDMRFSWPAGDDGAVVLLAPGALGEEAVDGSRRSARFVVDSNVSHVTFAMGAFGIDRRRVADVEVVTALDPRFDRQIRSELPERVAHAVAVASETFGPSPFDTIRVVSSSSGYVDAFPGWITVGVGERADRARGFTPLDGIARQWWGQCIGVATYRDRWISEAMARYFVDVYLEKTGVESLARARRWPTHPAIRLTPSGASYARLGPVVLGRRLDSADSHAAFESVAGHRGASLLHALDLRFGREDFHGYLRAIGEAAKFRPISTEVFLDAIERLSSSSLDWLRPYVYGTAVPTVHYRRDVDPQGDGTWKSTFHWELRPDLELEYAVVMLPDGRFDLKHRRSYAPPDPSFVMPVPFDLLGYDKSAPGGRKAMRDREPNRRVRGRTLLQGTSGSFESVTDFEPIAYGVDSGNRTPALVEPIGGRVKAERRRAGSEAAFRGDSDLARAAYLEAIEAPASDWADHRRLGFDARVWYRIADLELDRGDTAAAREAIEMAQNTSRWFDMNKIKLVRARADLLDRDYDGVFRRIGKESYYRTALRRERAGLLALAALGMKDMKRYEEERDVAMNLGVNVDVLLEAERARSSAVEGSADEGTR